REGRYHVEQGGDLWQLLVMITLTKMDHQVKRHTNKKRGVQREQCFGSEDSLFAMNQALPAREPTPMAALVLSDQVEQLMRPLDPSQRRILELRLQGFNLHEIAAAVQCSQATVRRLLDRVKGQLKAWYSTHSAS